MGSRRLLALLGMVVLMALALLLTFAQFRFVERRVNYSV